MAFLLIFLLNLIYLPAIKYGLVSDDAAELKMWPYNNVKRSKAFSILVHWSVAEYIYIAFGMSQVSLLAALLFSIHPETIQVSCWRAARHYGFNALLFLLVLAFAPLSFPVYLFSIMGIGTTLLTPFVFLFTEYWYLSFLFPALAILSYKALYNNVDSKIHGNQFLAPLPQDFKLYKFSWNKIIIAIKTFGYYVLVCLLPLKNGFFNSFMTTLGSSEKETKYWFSFNKHFWGGILAIAGLFIIWCFNIHNIIGMGIILFVAAIIPFLNFITVQQFTAPRYAYLSLIGLQIALVGLLVQFGAIGLCIIAGLFVFYLDRMIKVRRIYKKNDVEMIYLDSMEFSDNPRLWYYRYEHQLHLQNDIMAFAEVTYGLKHLPQDSQLWFGLSCAAFNLGDMNAARQFLENSEKYMIMVERTNMKELIAEMKQRIQLKLEGKWNPNNARRF